MTRKSYKLRWGCSSVVEHLLRVLKALTLKTEVGWLFSGRASAWDTQKPWDGCLLL